MGNYHLKTHMFAIEMVDFVNNSQDRMLHTLGPITIDFKDLYMSFIEG